MIELYFLRHAHAGDRTTWEAPDATRPLSEKGERQADRLGRYLASVGFAPDAVIALAQGAGVPDRRARRASTSACRSAIDPRLGGPSTWRTSTRS